MRGRSSRDLPGELGGVDAAVDLELQEQAIGATRELGHEAQGLGVGVDVEEGEVAPAQRDEVALRAEVVLDRDGPAAARDGEAELGLGAGPAGARRESDLHAVE